MQRGSRDIGQKVKRPFKDKSYEIRPPLGQVFLSVLKLLVLPVIAFCLVGRAFIWLAW
jgi:Na+/H+-dicarboxylate symporter